MSIGTKQEQDHVCDESCQHEKVEAVTINKDTLASNYIVGNTRQDDELYCDFKCRLYWEQMLLKQYLHGRTIWDGKGRTMLNMERRTDGRISKSRVKKDKQIERKQAISNASGRLSPEEVKVLNRKRKAKFIKACEK